MTSPITTSETTNPDKKSSYSSISSSSSESTHYESRSYDHHSRSEHSHSSSSSSSSSYKDYYGSHKDFERSKYRDYQGEPRLFIIGIPSGFDEEDLRRAFEKYGKIVDLFIPFDKEKNRKKNFAYLTYENYEQCKDAIDDTHERLRLSSDTKPLKVVFAKSKESSSSSSSSFASPSSKYGKRY